MFCRHGFHLHPDGARHPEVSDSDSVRHAVGQDGVREQSDIWGGGLHLGHGTQLCRPTSTGMVEISAGVIRSQVRIFHPTSKGTFKACGKRAQGVQRGYNIAFVCVLFGTGHTKSYILFFQ